MIRMAATAMPVPPSFSRTTRRVSNASPITARITVGQPKYQLIQETDSSS